MHCVIDNSTGLTSAAKGEKKNSPNRVMYSPFYEPESAPALNYFDVGSSDKQIIKLMRLNKSLFVFK
jgi:predicted RNA-binding protein